jgi:5-formyltetrahydrofolate cyclo-ligase
MTDKSAARAAAHARRAAAHRQGHDACTHLTDVLTAYRGLPLAGYLPMRSEIDPLPAMAAAAQCGPVCAPVIMAQGAPLQFRRWTPDCALIMGTFGAQIPASGDWITPQVLIVPLLAFSRTGGRLGYGGGFYDRTLQALRAAGPVTAIGFAYAAQEDADLPLELTDQPLDLIVTETGIFRV